MENIDTQKPLNQQIIDKRQEYFDKHFDWEKFSEILKYAFRAKDLVTLRCKVPKNHLDILFMEDSLLYLNPIYKRNLAHILEMEGFFVGIGSTSLCIKINYNE